MSKDIDVGPITTIRIEYKCRIIVPPGPDACGERPTRRVTFADGDFQDTCENCAIRLRQVIGHTVKIEKLEKT